MGGETIEGGTSNRPSHLAAEDILALTAGDASSDEMSLGVSEDELSIGQNDDEPIPKGAEEKQKGKMLDTKKEATKLSLMSERADDNTNILSLEPQPEFPSRGGDDDETQEDKKSGGKRMAVKSTGNPSSKASTATGSTTSSAGAFRVSNNNISADDDDILEEEQTTSAELSPPERAPAIEPLVSATKVVEREDVVDENVRENIRQNVLRELAHTEAEVVDAKIEDRRKTLGYIAICFCVVVGVSVGLGVGLSQNANVEPTASPTMAPTSSACNMCYDPNNNVAAQVTAEVQNEPNWFSTIVAQTPLRSCRNVLDSSLDYSIWDEGCTRVQADASWKCGCPVFPPVPRAMPITEEGYINCALCPEGEIASNIRATDPASKCVGASTWLDIVGRNVTNEECVALKWLAGDGCECVPENIVTGRCISSLDAITTFENSEVTDESVPRTYVLCPNTEFKVGIARLHLWLTGNGIQEGQLPIAGRSNMKILCGTDGSSSNNCTIRDGSFGIFQSNGWSISESITQDNLHIQGITFVNVTNPLGLYTPVNITIEDCIFDQFGGAAILSMPWNLGPAPSRLRNLRQEESSRRALQSSIDPEAIRGTIRISNSIFRNGRWRLKEQSSTIWMRQPDDEKGPTGVLGKTAMSLHVENCLFDGRGNDRYFDSIILGRGQGYINLTNSCLWGGQYTLNPIVMDKESVSHVINDDPEYDLSGTFYLKDYQNLTDMTQYCAVVRRGSADDCIAYFSGEISACQRWGNVLDNDSTVIQTRLYTADDSECGTALYMQKNYRGTINTTRSGRTCQAWDVQYPHTHTRTADKYPRAGLEANYCRNPDNEESAWCYTTDPFKRFEPCDVPNCPQESD